MKKFRSTLLQLQKSAKPVLFLSKVTWLYANNTCRCPCYFQGTADTTNMLHIAHWKRFFLWYNGIKFIIWYDIKWWVGVLSRPTIVPVFFSIEKLRFISWFFQVFLYHECLVRACKFSTYPKQFILNGVIFYFL